MTIYFSTRLISRSYFNSTAGVKIIPFGRVKIRRLKVTSSPIKELKLVMYPTFIPPGVNLTSITPAKD